MKSYMAQMLFQAMASIPDAVTTMETIDESSNVKLLQEVFPLLDKRHTKPNNRRGISNAEWERYYQSVNKPKRAHKDRHKKGKP
jgi:hypothetical protein